MVSVMRAWASGSVRHYALTVLLTIRNVLFMIVVVTTLPPKLRLRVYVFAPRAFAMVSRVGTECGLATAGSL